MRLLDVRKLKLREFPNDKTRPQYAILSHTWGDGEVSLQDLPTWAAKYMAGYAKIKKCCEVAMRDGFEYVWIDTCCIDKTSSAELSEAINSMYNWYQSAAVCYTYLSDVQGGRNPSDTESSFFRSRWFTRGWTLQELLAPKIVMFYDCNWIYIGTKRSLQKDISRITDIPHEALLNVEKPEKFSIAQRMSWAAKRETTRAEDIAYCLLGIFGVNMPTLYGEGEKAFLRLQHEIMKDSDDHSLFAWFFKRSREFGSGYQDVGVCNNEEGRQDMENSLSYSHGIIGYKSGLLSSSPQHFESAQGVQRTKGHKSSLHPFSMTNNGLHIWLPMVRVPLPKNEVYQVIFNCNVRDRDGALTIFLVRNQSGQYSRIFPRLLCTAGNLEYNPEPVELYVKGDYGEEPKSPVVKKRLEYQLHLVENSSPNTGYMLMSASTPQTLQHKVVNLHLGSTIRPGYSLTDIAYIIVGPKHDHLARCLIALGISVLRDSQIFYHICSGEKDIEEAIDKIRKSEQGLPDMLFKRVLPGMDPAYLGERVIQELPGGQSISIHFRNGPESSDGVQIYHIVMEFVTPA